jgi:hypothetical protein
MSSANRVRAAAAGLVAAAQRALRRRLLRLLGDELAQLRQRSYDDGVAVGRELQQAMHTGEAPFAPPEFGASFPRRGVEAPPERPSPRPRSGGIAPLRSTTPRQPWR